MSTPYSFNSTELLRAAKETAEQVGLQLETIIKAVEASIELAARKKYGNYKIVTSIDRKTGAISIFREITVVDSGPFDGDFISLSGARLIKEDAKVGEVIQEQLPPIDVSYTSAKIAQKRIKQIIQEEERRKQYEEFKNRVGTILRGRVKEIEYHGLIVDINGNEAYLKTFNLIKGEVFRQGDNINAYVEDVRNVDYGAQIFLSRTHKGFVEQLFKEEIPEIYDGIVVIKAIARDAGSRTKVAVSSFDKNIDPVGTCIGIKGYRVKNIKSQLNDEKIDVVKYSTNLAEFVVEAIAPAKVSRVIIDEDESFIELVIPEDQLSMAIGKRGQNIRLASALVGWKINVLSNKENSEKRAQELEKGLALFVDALDVEEIIGQLLITEGFFSVEDVAQASISDLASIEGFNEEIAIALRDRAVQYLKNKEHDNEAELKELEVDQFIKELPHLQANDIIVLYNNGIKTIDDLAGLSDDEFCSIVSRFSLGEEVNEIIMQARKKVGLLDN